MHSSFRREALQSSGFNMAVRPPDEPAAMGSSNTVTTTSSNVRPLRRTNEHAAYALPTPAAAPTVAARNRRRPATANTSPPLGPDTARRGRGRRRTLPLMTNSERARYYRRKHAEESNALDASTVQLRQQVRHLEIRLRVHRQLVQKTVAAPARHRIVAFVDRFVSEHVQSQSHGLCKQHHAIDRVELYGDAAAPIIRVVSELRGRLTTPVIHDMYPFVLGNTIVLDALMHQEVTYACAYLFYFDGDGMLVRESVEIDAIAGLRRPLQTLATVARVLRDVDVHAAATDRRQGEAEQNMIRD